MTNQVQLQEIATNLAGAGFPVFPMTSKKVPLVPRGYHDATTDADTVDLWFRKPALSWLTHHPAGSTCISNRTRTCRADGSQGQDHHVRVVFQWQHR
jgi:hypothetical protein